MPPVSTIQAYTFPDSTIQYSACPSIQTGVTDIEYSFLNGTINNGGNKRTITFPYIFNTIPKVMLTSQIPIISGSNFGCCYWINNITTSAFEISAVNAYNNTTTINIIFNWVAMGT